MINRIVGVLTLNAETYEEIEHDENALTEAAIIVAVVAVASGIGSGVGSTFAGGSFIGGFLGAIISSFIGWGLWSAITYFIGTNVFNGRATMGEMLRVIGYAQAPLVLNILTAIPLVGCLAIVWWVWALATGFVAVRQGLDLDNTQTAVTVVIGWVFAFIVGLAIALIFGGAAIIGSALGGG